MRECFISTKGYILPTSVYAVILIVTQLKYNVTCEMFYIKYILFHIRLLAFKMRKVIFIKQFYLLYTLVFFMILNYNISILSLIHFVKITGSIMLDSEDPRTEAIRRSFQSDPKIMVQTSGKSKTLNQWSINVYLTIYNSFCYIL